MKNTNQRTKAVKLLRVLLHSHDHKTKSNLHVTTCIYAGCNRFRPALHQSLTKTICLYSLILYRNRINYIIAYNISALHNSFRMVYEFQGGFYPE